jgi:hypothetical protein
VDREGIMSEFNNMDDSDYNAVMQVLHGAIHDFHKKNKLNPEWYISTMIQQLIFTCKKRQINKDYFLECMNKAWDKFGDE